MRIGLLGGSFDPVHRAHLEIARRARRQLRLDEVWLLPAAQPPHKSGGALASVEHRLAMLRLAVQDQVGIAICTLELDHDDLCYSVDSLNALCAVHPEHQFSFVMGEDSFDALGRWRRPDVLVQMAPPVVAPRPEPSGATSRGGRAGLGRVAEVFGVPVHWLAGLPMDLSSSRLREELRKGAEPDGMIPSVLEYAKKHRLYLEAGGP